MRFDVLGLMFFRVVFKGKGTLGWTRLFLVEKEREKGRLECRKEGKEGNKIKGERRE